MRALLCLAALLLAACSPQPAVTTGTVPDLDEHTRRHHRGRGAGDGEPVATSEPGEHVERDRGRFQPEEDDHEVGRGGHHVETGDGEQATDRERRHGSRQAQFHDQGAGQAAVRVGQTRKYLGGRQLDASCGDRQRKSCHRNGGKGQQAGAGIRGGGRYHALFDPDRLSLSFRTPPRQPGTPFNRSS